MSKKSTTSKKPNDSVPESEKVHPWRRCAKETNPKGMQRLHFFYVKLAFILFFLIFYCLHGQAEEHRAKFLTEIHGILDDTDTDSPGSWQCFESNQLHLNYRTMHYEEDWKSIMSELEISVLLENLVTNTYSFPRLYPTKLCKQWIKEWQVLLKNEPFVCMSGVAPLVDKNSMITDWGFERLKTKKGCWGRTSEC